jgi:macrolide transport system ATP-binding/permease protein
MHWWRSILQWRPWPSWQRREADFDRELRNHLDLEAEGHQDEGVSPDEARSAARRAFGNATLVKEDVRAIWGWTAVEQTIQDLRYSVRTLSKAPAFTAVALISIALGIAANTTVFSLIDAMWFRTLPVHDAEQLVRVYAWGLPRGSNRPGVNSFSWPLYDALRRRSTVLTDLVAHYSTAPLQVSADGETSEVQGAVVSANYFPMLGIQPALGRFFLPEEDQVRGRDTVAIISMGLWQRRFGGEPTVLGRLITINGVIFRIIGIAPEEFHGIVPGEPPNDLWIPTMMLETGYRWCSAFNDDCTPLDVIGRLPPGRRLEQARAELSAIIASADTAPGYSGPRSAFLDRAIGLDQYRRNQYTNHMKLMAAIAALLLILACTNVAGLLMARGIARQRELAVRLSIGAGRFRLVRQMLTESLVLAVAGNSLGLLLTFWTRHLLLSFYATNSEGYANFYDLRIDSLTLTVSLALAILTGLLFGLVPAIQATKPDVALALKSDSVSRGGPASHVRAGLVMAQVALSLVMIVSAGLLARSALQIEWGGTFDPHGVAVLRLRPKLLQYPPARSQAFLKEVIRRLEALPGVESVTFARGIGLVWRSCCLAYLPERGKEAMRADYHVVAPQYFSTLRIPLLAGREFDQHDRVGSPSVAIVNQTLARRIDPRGSVVGRAFVADGKSLEVVGVVKDSYLRSVADAPAPLFYTPFWQSPDETDARMAIRVHGDPRAMLPVLRRAIAEVDSQVPVTEQMTMLDQVRSVFMQARLAAAVLLCASVLALVLSAVGLYGVIAYMVGRRTREIAVRMALGARPSSVRALVLKQSLAVVAPGMAIGVIAALATTRLLGSWLYGVGSTDFWTFVTGGSVLFAAALAASWIPARRAARVDPMAALRCD